MKIKITKNILFILFLMLSNVISINIYSKHNSLVKDRSLIQIKQDESTIETTASEDVVSSEESLATEEASEDTPTHPSTESPSENTHTPEESSPNQSVEDESAQSIDNVEAEQESRAMQKAQENAVKIMDLQEALVDHSETVADVSDLIADIEKISEEMHETVESDKNILESIDNLIDYFTKLDMAIQQQGVESSQKLNKINKHLSKQLENQLYLQLYALQNEVTDITEDINKLDQNIDNIKIKIPETDTFCSIFSNCFSCTSNPGCGWCSMTNKCIEGVKEGPLDGSCQFWEYGKCSGPKQCKDYKSCDMCVGDISCGWCGNKEPVCMEKEIGQKECLLERFIHTWNNSNNICPKAKEVN
jgi:hypothetical protein